MYGIKHQMEHSPIGLWTTPAVTHWLFMLCTPRLPTDWIIQRRKVCIIQTSSLPHCLIFLIFLKCCCNSNYMAVPHIFIRHFHPSLEHDIFLRGSKTFILHLSSSCEWPRLQFWCVWTEYEISQSIYMLKLTTKCHTYICSSFRIHDIVCTVHTLYNLHKMKYKVWRAVHWFDTRSI